MTKTTQLWEVEEEVLTLMRSLRASDNSSSYRHKAITDRLKARVLWMLS